MVKINLKMKELLTEPIGSIKLDEENKILIIKFNGKNGVRESEYFKYVEEILWKYTEYLKQYNLDKVIYDMTDVDVLVDEEFTEWITKNITPLVQQAGLKKLAFVLPKSSLVKLDLKYIITPKLDEYKGPDRRIFNTYQEALDWLLEA